MLVNSIEPVKPNGVATLAFDGSTTLNDLSEFAKSQTGGTNVTIVQPMRKRFEKPMKTWNM